MKAWLASALLLLVAAALVTLLLPSRAPDAAAPPASTGPAPPALQEPQPLRPPAQAATSRELARGAAAEATLRREVPDASEAQEDPPAVAGIVLDDAGRPLAGAVVAAEPWLDLFSGGNHPRTTSGADGTFRFERLDAGVRMIALKGEDEDSGELTIEQVAVEVRPGETAHVVLGGVRRPVLVVGRVTGVPEGAADEILALGDGPNPLGAEHTAELDPSGHFELRLPAAGAYAFVLELETHLHPFPIVDVPQVERFELELALPAGRISGVLLDPAGDGVPGQIRVSRDPLLPSLDLRLLQGVETGEDGSFTLVGLEPGAYLLVGPCTQPARARVDGVAPVEDLVLRQVRGATVLGRVLDDAGAPADEVAVFVFDEDGRWLPLDDLELDNGDDGTFEVESLPPGRYRFMARTRTSASPTSERIDVVAGADAKVELRLAPGVFLEPRLRDRARGPLAAAWSVRDARGCNHAGLFAEAEFTALLVHGPRLREPRFGPLPPGAFTLEALAEDGRRGHARVTLEPGPPRRLDLRAR